MTHDKSRRGDEDPLSPDPLSSDAAGQTDAVSGADAEAEDLLGWTTLHYAVISQPAEVVARLVDGGADPDVRDAHGRTPLHHAASAGRTKVVNLLLDRGADIEARNASGWTALYEAAMEERTKVAKILVDRGADIEARNASGWTALYGAALGEQLKVVNLLAGLGANIDAKDANGDTPLIQAVVLERVQVVGLLVDRGADVDAKDDRGDTALHWAARLERTKIAALIVADLLLDRRAHIEARNAYGETPLHQAAASDRAAVAALLLDRGADIEAKDADGRTPLHHAASSGRAQVTALLLDRGADIHAKDANDSTPTHDAAISGRAKVLNLLSDRGADLDCLDETLLLDTSDEDDDVASLLRDRGIVVAPTSGQRRTRPVAPLAIGDESRLLVLETKSRSNAKRVAVGCLVLLVLYVAMTSVGTLGDWLLTPGVPYAGKTPATTRDRTVRPIPDQPLNERPANNRTVVVTAGRGEEAGVRAIRPTVVTLATWRDSIAPTVHATRTLLRRGDDVVLRTRYSDGTSHTEEVIERPSGRPNERRFDIEPDNDQSEYITVTDSGVVRWFAWDGTNFLTQRATRIHADFLALGTNLAQQDCIPRQLSPTSREIVTLYEQLQDFKDHRDFEEFGFSVGGPYHRWMENATSLAESSLDETALQLDHLGFTGGDVMNLGFSYLNPESEEEQQNITDTERRIRAGLAFASCDSSVSPQ